QLVLLDSTSIPLSLIVILTALASLPVAPSLNPSGKSHLAIRTLIAPVFSFISRSTTCIGVKYVSPVVSLLPIIIPTTSPKSENIQAPESPYVPRVWYGANDHSRDGESKRPSFTTLWRPERKPDCAPEMAPQPWIRAR